MGSGSKQVAREFDFEREKFKELVLFFADACKNDPCFGSINLNKMLSLAENLAYLAQGRPIAGATYQHLPLGPAPKELVPVRRELIAEGRLDLVERSFLGKKQKRPVALSGPNMSMFNDIEREVCDYVVGLFSNRLACENSDWSHEVPGWRLTAEGEEIPYSAAFLGLRKQTVTSADQQWASDQLESHPEWESSKSRRSASG